MKKKREKKKIQARPPEASAKGIALKALCQFCGYFFPCMPPFPLCQEAKAASPTDSCYILPSLANILKLAYYIYMHTLYVYARVCNGWDVNFSRVVSLTAVAAGRRCRASIFKNLARARPYIFPQTVR